MNDYIEQLRASPMFQEHLEKVKAARPVVPQYTPRPDNTDQWKAQSLMLQGFNLCLMMFGEDDE